MLHLLIHMEQQAERVTSELMSEMLGTNPVVVRRMMSGLRDKGLVRSTKGHGGGWELTRGLESITLLDVYQAIGSPPLFSFGLQEDHPECLVEKAVDSYLEDAFTEAELLILGRFGSVSVASLAEDLNPFLLKQRHKLCGLL